MSVWLQSPSVRSPDTTTERLPPEVHKPSRPEPDSTQSRKAGEPARGLRRPKAAPELPESVVPSSDWQLAPVSREAESRARPLPLTLRQTLAMTAVIIAAAVGGTYAVAKWWELRNEPLRPFQEMKGEWIQATSDMDVYTGLFRRNLRLPGHVRNAWIAVAPCDGFEVTINGSAVGWQYMWRPTRAYQTNLSERGQWITWPKVAMALNFAREYQWTEHESYRLPILIDLTPYLRIGQNVIGIEVETNRAPAKVRFDGAITMWSGEVISLASGSEWKAEVNAPYQHGIDWRSPEYSTLSWRNAALADPPPGQLLRAFDPRIYSTEFRGRWIRHPTASAQDSIWFQTEWHLDQTPDEAWLRLATNRNFELFINRQRGFPGTPDPRGLESGEWIYGHKRAADPALNPEQMYSHDVGKDFVTHQFIAPRKEPLGLDKHRFKTIVKPSPDKAKDYDRAWGLEPQEPLMMRHDRAVGAYVAYNLTGMLQRGKNTIAVRLNRPAAADPANWRGQIALDGEISFAEGARLTWNSNQAWKTSVFTGDSTQETLVSAREEGPALQAGHPLTKLQYRGAPEPLEFLPAWSGAAAATSACGVLAFAGLLTVKGWWPRRRKPAVASGSPPPPTAKTIAILFDALLPFTAVVAGILVVQTAFGERSEQLWLMQPSVWLWSIVAAVALGAIAAGLRAGHRSGNVGVRGLATRTARVIRELPGTRLWIFLLVWLSILTFFLRAYRLDFQPMDYDENPSLLALLSVARSGVPSYVPEAVWYTRSPLYHYITGGIVRVFGENLWATRLPSALFGVATSVLLYFCGSRLLKRPWIGMAAFLLTIIHPQMVMTGHMIRFYQQQQFFALLMTYWFCKGFVTGQSQRYRYLTVAAYLAAALSQEITAVVAVPLGIGYLLFAGRKSIQENSKLIIAIGCALLVIVVDFAVYETNTMTRLEGYSTTMQADVGPHFWEPYNFLTVFLNYSRIHLPLALMFLFGLPAALRERNRTVLALHVVLIGSIIMLNLMVTQVSARYVYWLFPLFFLLAIDNARAGLAWLDAMIHRRLSPARAVEALGVSSSAGPGGGQGLPSGRVEPDASRLSFAPLTCFLILFAATVVSWSPWRLPATYNTKLLADSNGAFQYIRSQMRPDDIIVVAQPNAKGALMEIGRVDYELHIPMVYDFVLRENGRLIERGAGAGVIYTVEQLQRLCAEHGRVWLAIDREKYPFRGKDVSFHRTGARAELFLRKNTNLMHRTYFWNVYLWDADQGRYQSFRYTPD